MTDSGGNHPLVPSILDRLLGAERPREINSHRERAKLIRQLKASLQRDLQNLLNSRWRCGAIPEQWEELNESLVRYGIPDLTGANVGTVTGRHDFLRVIEKSIESFEPRLCKVRVTHIDKDAEPIERMLRFRIEAVLVAEQDSQQIEFVSTMEPTSGSFDVTAGER